MKVFVVILCLASASVSNFPYTVKTKEDLARFREECGKQLNVPADKLEKYKSWEYPNDEVTRCYMKCVFEKFGFFDETHGFNPYLVHHQLAGGHEPIDHSDEIHQKIDMCADHNTEKSDACTWAYRGGMCFLQNHLKLVQDSIHSH
ncbi:general odorant-binding protein 99a-like [Musca vetustissima]|uniref:general odorant-binding protein 99a-like n=1 Tax=Musca vetustissima TaxID=27455 RepID=UPI002AB7EE6C|nr:general odorant-binding protein 99a-like [Musca vetustissima]